MDTTLSLWDRYWSLPVLQANLLLFANLLGALLLGLLVGYERAYHSRAAGMRTYGIVCMASAALTAFVAYPDYWWGLAHTVPMAPVDPTRVVQGIVTGIGFLGAGVIMRDGFNISGLSTAASIWATAGIGVLVGVGFYATAILLALLTAALMMWGGWMEARLPALSALAVTLRFAPREHPSGDELRAALEEWGFQMAVGTLRVEEGPDASQWHFVMVARRLGTEVSIPDVVRRLRALEGVQALTVAHARN
ncbi:MAG: MgtC/SapB family protein [Tepidimonas ignava]|uniref:Protein MgtC n=1 Tax=Tepidimonas ignava TaxID=114249 RepID=A0A4R3LK91_9BURK|nr:MgtC/SapB family protein [Tepidimonas ignava]MCX7814060.1 MgtC/SapB family protein [Tepidimonas ignava]TCS98126.1 putative Mg2+ transporter-C (MgtC) family protein [Tepidimonas ignava]TSE22633.1 MgtC family protein [Tepidimonas ignava]